MATSSCSEKPAPQELPTSYLTPLELSGCDREVVSSKSYSKSKLKSCVLVS
ncbi:hypothetical protein HanRHA438_Chr01g0034611 [Helianthus annuus]|nr:hypothetical protein HanRHA438_Chr01g0034611 [Helianthus annuus]